MFEQEIARGMEWLDHMHPGWELLIDLGKLDLQSSCACMLGQLEGDYWTALDNYGWYDTTVQNDAAQFGFSVRYDLVNGHHWGILTEEWATAIKQRLDEGVVL